MKIYGLTGSIATGKSTVANILKEHCNVPIIDADNLAREAVEIGSNGLRGIINEFGQEILLPDGSLNRKRLGNIVFGDNKAIEVLNSIVHPEVRILYNKYIEGYRQKGYKTIIYDCPLLIEANLMDSVDEIILVVADESTQLKRLMERNNFNEEEAMKRIQSQMKVKEKISYANYVIYNDVDYEGLKDGVIYLWKEKNEK